MWQSGVVSLEPASLYAEACRDVGVPAAGEPQFVDGLTCLTEAVDAEAELHEDGRRRARAALVAALKTQLQVEAALARAPEIGQTRFWPIVITGLYRSGTTFLQQLLAQHPDLRAPQLWELMAPASPEGEPALVAGAQAYVDEYYRAAPQFRPMHELGARLPEECHRLLGVTFQNSIYALRYRIPGYSRWLDRQPMTPAYEYHRLLIQCLLQRRGGDNVVLKCPTHLWHLDALAAVYPDAHVLRLHRSPTVALPSICSLTAVVRSARTDKVDRYEIGRYWLDRLTAALTGVQAAVPPGPQLLDLRYADLIADPLATVARICDHIGLPLSDEARTRMWDFIENQSHPSGAHVYRADDFGLSLPLLEEMFGDYIADFRL